MNKAKSTSAGIVAAPRTENEESSNSLMPTLRVRKNPIRNIIQSRIRQLLERYNESSSIKHTATKGSLREGYLKQFIADVAPTSLSVSSGFVVDARGESMSPQIDLLVFDPTAIPPFSLSDFVVVLPIESVCLSIEVKSALRASSFAQVREQQATFRNMRISLTAGTREYLYTVDCAGVPQFIVAFNSDCSLATIQTWFGDEPSLIAVCVIGKHTVFKDPRTDRLTTIVSDEHHNEVMILIGLMETIHRRVAFEFRDVQKQISIEGDTAFFPDIGAYICFDVPDDGKKVISDDSKSST